MSDIKQIEQLYSNSYLSYLASYVGAIFVLILFKNVADETILYSWFIIFTVLTAIRFSISWCFQKKDHTNNPDIWLIAFLCMSLVSGTLWGLTGFVLVPHGALSFLDSVLYHGMLLLIIAVLIAGSLFTYSPSKLVYLSFSFPAVVPQSLMLVAKGDKYHSFLGGFILAFALTVFVVSIFIHRMFSEHSVIKTENELYKKLLDENNIKIENR